MSSSARSDESSCNHSGAGNQDPKIADESKNGSSTSLSAQASTLMAAGLCCHFLGNEFARAASLSLITSQDMGLGSESISYTVIIGSPISALVLYLYTNSIKRNGPYMTMLISNVACTIVLAYITFSIQHLRGNWGKFFVLFFYSFREIYVTLISTQQWSFIATVLNKSTSSYIVKYSGLVSISSAVGGLVIQNIVQYGGVQALLIMALSASLLSWSCSELAYSLVRNSYSAFEKSFDQKAEHKKQQKAIRNSKNFWISAAELIWNNETLLLLFCEAIIHQLCGNMLNLIFYDGLRQSIPDNSERAVVIGRFFASVNTIACILQCFVLPHLLSHFTLPRFLLGTPLLVMSFIFLSIFMHENSVYSVTIGFGTVKILEYSIMTAATEMIYMPLDYEVRYIGKEFIRFFGHRLGKSASSVVLSLASAQLNWSRCVQLSVALAFSIIWEIVMMIVAKHLINRDSAGSNFSAARSSNPVEDTKHDIHVNRVDTQLLASRSTAYLPNIEDAMKWSESQSQNIEQSNSTENENQNSDLSDDDDVILCHDLGETLIASHEVNDDDDHDIGLTLSPSSGDGDGFFESPESSKDKRLKYPEKSFGYSANGEYSIPDENEQIIAPNVSSIRHRNPAVSHSKRHPILMLGFSC